MQQHGVFTACLGKCAVIPLGRELGDTNPPQVGGGTTPAPKNGHCWPQKWPHYCVQNWSSTLLDSKVGVFMLPWADFNRFCPSIEPFLCQTHGLPVPVSHQTPPSGLLYQSTRQLGGRPMHGRPMGPSAGMKGCHHLPEAISLDPTPSHNTQVGLALLALPGTFGVPLPLLCMPPPPPPPFLERDQHMLVCGTLRGSTWGLDWELGCPPDFGLPPRRSSSSKVSKHT